MLPKNYRLKNNSAFNATYRIKNTRANKYLLLYIGSEIKDETQQTKIGFVISKKFHKRAVKRNRTKRLLREIIRLKLKNNELKNLLKYRSIIFIARSPLLNQDYKTVEEAINQLLKEV